MATEIITKEDLRQFKSELLDDLQKIIGQAGKKESREWLKSIEVRRILQVSSGTLQNLRIRGRLHYTKVGGIFYYRYEDIQNMLKGNR